MLKTKKIKVKETFAITFSFETNYLFFFFFSVRYVSLKVMDIKVFGRIYIYVFVYKKRGFNCQYNAHVI